jgi:hypothetical protein
LLLDFGFKFDSSLRFPLQVAILEFQFFHFLLKSDQLLDLILVFFLLVLYVADWGVEGRLLVRYFD